jgi:Xaa-Pro aminopeptidase
MTFLQLKAGPRSAYPHAVTCGRVFEANEIGFADIGIVHAAYRADYARAFVIGDPPAEARRIVDTVDRIQGEARHMVKPGVPFASLYRDVRQMFAAEGYPDAMPHHLGHTLGVDGDTWQLIVPTSDDVFVEGEVICLEPAVYVPGVGGCRIEDTLVVRGAGNEVLSQATRVARC